MRCCVFLTADYRSPATTTNHYASADPTAVSNASNLATLGHPAGGVVINEDPNAYTTSQRAVATTTTTTTTAAQQAAPVVAAKHTLPSGQTGDGLVVASNLGGPLGGTIVLGGQCECLRNGGTCGHGAGQCTCRGCTTAATSINPGINIGVSTHQYTAPVGTSGIGGGVGEGGVGMAGVVNPTNPIGQPVSAAVQNCDCVRNKGVCKCAPGQCECTNCTAHRKSLAATQATSGARSTTTTTTGPASTTTTGPLGGSEYVDTNTPYKPSDYTEGKPVNSNRMV